MVAGTLLFQSDWGKQLGSPAREGAARVEAGLDPVVGLDARVGSEREEVLAEVGRLEREAGGAAWDLPVDEARLVAFRAWAEAYGKASEEERPGMLVEGRRLAQERLAGMAELIESDPRRALAAALPYRVRKQLPSEILELTERRVSARGAFNVVASFDPSAAGGSVPGLQRIAQVGEEVYEVHTFGDGLEWRGQADAEFNGIAVPLAALEGGGQVAIAPAPFGAPQWKAAFSPFPTRLLEPDEARDYVAEQAEETVCEVSKRKVEGTDEEVWVVERTGIRQAFCTVTHADSTVGGLPPGGGDFAAYGGPDAGPAVNPAGLPVGGNASGTADQSFTKGLGRRYLLIRHKFSDYATVTSDAVVTTAYNNHATHVAAGSYGQNTCAPLSANVNANGTWLLPPVLMPRTRADYAAGTADITRDTFDAVNALLQAAGHSYTEYQYFVMITHSGANLIGGGMGSVGPWNAGYPGTPAGMKLGWSWNGMGTDTNWATILLSHECGHNLYLNHAHTWISGSIIGAGSTDEYGDGLDVMGGASSDRNYSSAFRAWLGWIPAADAPAITSNGKYRLHTVDENAGPGIRALRVTNPSYPTQAYWIEHRDGINGGAQSTEFKNSVVVRWGSGNGAQTWRLNMAAARLGGNYLNVGHTFTDPVSKVHITPVAQVGTAATPAVDVVVNVGDSAGNRAPVVTLAASTLVPASGENITLTATATDPDGDPLAFGWDFAGGSQSADNQRIQTRSFATGEHVVQLRVSDMKGGVTRKSVIVRAGNPTTYRISGVVVDAAGVPLAGRRVGPTNSSKFVLTDSDGSYTLVGLNAGTWLIAVREPVADSETLAATFTSSVVLGTSNVTGVDFAKVDPDATNSGITGTYFGTETFTTQKFTRRDATINFNWALGAPGAGMPVDNFSVRWTGRLLPTKSGKYEFRTPVQGGVRLYVGGELVIDNWASHTGEDVGFIALAAGTYYDIKLEYRNVTGPASVRLDWLPPAAVARTPVPDGSLTPATNFVVAEYYADRVLGAANYKGSRIETANINYNFNTSGPSIAGISQSNFSVRWTGRFTAPSSGTYRFFTNADDGSRLWIGGTQVINNWVTQGVAEVSGTIALTAGQTYDLKLEYFQGDGGAEVALLWQPPGGTKAQMPVNMMQPPSRPDHLYAELFANKNLTGLPTVTRWDSTVDFNFGGKAPDPRMPAADFSIRWSGRLLATTAGIYTFYTQADEGTRLWIDGQAVINDWTTHTVTERSGTITLAAGQWVDLRLEYFQATGPSQVKLLWKPPGGTKVTLPAANLAIRGGNSAPFVSPLADQLIDPAVGTASVNFQVGDAETAASALSVTLASSDTVLLPLSRVVLGGSGLNRTLAVTPVAGLSGSAMVTVTVSDGALSSSDSFAVNVSSTGTLTPGVWTKTAPGAYQWSTGSNWLDAVAPKEGPTASLDFLSGLTLVDGALTANQNIAASFRTNALVLGGTGPAAGSAAVSLTGNPLHLVGNPQATTATVDLNAVKGSGLIYDLAMPVTLAAPSLWSGTGTGTFVVSGPITGAGSLTKAGTSILILAASNSYAGPTTITAGTLQIGNGGASGTLGAAAVTNNASLSFARSDTALLVPNAIGGSGGVTMNGTVASVVTLSGANTFTGNVLIPGGALRITHSGALGSGTKTLTSYSGKGGLSLDGTSGNITLPTAISYVLSNNSKTIPAITNVAGNNTIAGNMTLRSGAGGTRMFVSGGSLLLSGNIAPNTAGRVLHLDGPADGSITGVIANQASSTSTLALEKAGNGTWTLKGLNTYTGFTAVNGGTLLVTGSLASGGTLTVASAAKFGGNGSIGATSTINGRHEPGNGGIGIQSFSGELTYSATARLAWELAANSTSGSGTTFDKVNAAAVTVTSGAKVDVVLNRPGSTVNLTNTFWQLRRSWTLLSGTAVTGTFSLGTVSADSGARVASTYGTFSLQSTATTVVLVWNPLTALQLWQQTNFPTNFDDPAIAANLADPDQDGLENIWEFIHGTDPQAPGSRTAPESSIIGDRLTLTFPRNPDGTDLTLVVQAAGSMEGPWINLATSTGGGPFTPTAPGATVTETPSGAMFRVEVKDTYFTNDPAHRKRFMRLQAQY